MRNVINILIVGIGLLMSACAYTSQETALPTPTPTEAPLHCSPDDKPLITEQVAYKGMLAGQTTFDEVKALFGQPTDYIGSTYWFENEDPVFWITFKEERIDEIEMYGDLALHDLITVNGCPDILTHTKLDSFGSIHDIFLVYLSAGVYYQYPGENLSPGLDVDNIYYFLPMGKDDFFRRNPLFVSNNPLPWDSLYLHCPDPFGDCASP